MTRTFAGINLRRPYQTRMMTSQKDDCYFFYYSNCSKGNLCPFRHEPAALGREEVCGAWLRGCCMKEGCHDRHMIINKNRSQTLCFWESQPGGCQKPHCVFFHKKTPQAVVEVPAPVPEKRTIPTFGVVPQKPSADPISVVATNVAPPVVKPAVRSEVSTTYQEDIKIPSTNQTRPVHTTGGRTVVNGSKTISPVKVVEAQVKINVKDRMSGLKNNSTNVSSSVTNISSSSRDGIIVKTLEQIHREKALASMKKKQDDDEPNPTLNNKAINKTELPSIGRKIVLIKDKHSEGEISDEKDSPVRKIEVTSDTENGRVRVQSSVKSRLGGSVTRKPESISTTRASSSSDIVVPPIAEEMKLPREVNIKLVPLQLVSPLKATRKRRQVESLLDVDQLVPVKKPARLQVASKVRQVKPDLQLYKPPRSAKSTTTIAQQEQQSLLPKSIIETKIQSKVSQPVMKDVIEEVVPTNNIASLLKKPQKDKEEKKPFGEVKIKSLDEILAEKQKRKSNDTPVALAVNHSSSMPNAVMRMLKRKADTPEVQISPKDSIEESKHSKLKLLKRRRNSVEKSISVSDGEHDGTVEREVVESPETSLPCDVETKMKQKDDDILSIDEDSLFGDEFLLDDISGSYPAVPMNDEELFKEVELLLE